MTGWFALALIVAVVLATAAIFAAGRKAGAATEAAKAQRAELESQKEVSDAKDRTLEVGAAALAIVSSLLTPARRLVLMGEGSRRSPAYSREFIARAAGEVQQLPPGAAIEQMLMDYQMVREQARICRRQ